MNRTLVTDPDESNTMKILPTSCTRQNADYHTKTESNFCLTISPILRSSSPTLTTVLVLFLPVLLLSVTTEATPSIELEARSCMDVDEAILREYLSTLNLTNDDNVTSTLYDHEDATGEDGQERDLPFGALRSDWIRLSLLRDAQSDESLREMLRHLSRLLVMAYFQSQDDDASQRSSIMQQIPGERSEDITSEPDDIGALSTLENSPFNSITEDLSTEESVTPVVEKKEDLRTEVRNCQKSLQRCLSGHAWLVKEIHNDAETFNEQLTSTEKTMFEQIDSGTEVFRNLKPSEASMSVRHYPATQRLANRRCSSSTPATSLVDSSTDETKEGLDRENSTAKPCAGTSGVQETTESFAYISNPSDLNVEQSTPKGSGEPLSDSSYYEQQRDGIFEEINANTKEDGMESNETLTEIAGNSSSLEQSSRVIKESNKSSEEVLTKSINWFVAPGKSKLVSEKWGSKEIEMMISENKNISTLKHSKSTGDAEVTEEVPIQITTIEGAGKKKKLMEILIKNLHEVSRIVPESEINFSSPHLTEVTESNAGKTFPDFKNLTMHNIKSTVAKTRPPENVKLEDYYVPNSNIPSNGSGTDYVILLKTAAKGIEQFNRTEEKVFSSSELTAVTQNTKERNETCSMENFMISDESSEVSKNLSEVNGATFLRQTISINRSNLDSDNATNFSGLNSLRLPIAEIGNEKLAEGVTETELPSTNIDRNFADDEQRNGTADLIEFHEPSNADEESQNVPTLEKTSFLSALEGFFGSDPAERRRLYESMTMKTRTRFGESEASFTERYSNGITFPSDSTFDSASGGNGMEDRSTFTASLKYSDTTTPSHRRLSKDYDDDVEGKEKIPRDNVSTGEVELLTKVGNVDSTRAEGIIMTSETSDSSSRMSRAFPDSESDFADEISETKRIVANIKWLNKEDAIPGGIEKNVSPDKTISFTNNLSSGLISQGNKEVESNLQLNYGSTLNLQESKVIEKSEMKTSEIASGNSLSGGQVSKTGLQSGNSSKIDATDGGGFGTEISVPPMENITWESQGALKSIESYLYAAARTSEEPSPINHDEEISFDRSRGIGRTRMNLPNTRKQETTDVNAE